MKNIKNGARFAAVTVGLGLSMAALPYFQTAFAGTSFVLTIASIATAGAGAVFYGSLRFSNFLKVSNPFAGQYKQETVSNPKKTLVAEDSTDKMMNNTESTITRETTGSKLQLRAAKLVADGVFFVGAAAISLFAVRALSRNDYIGSAVKSAIVLATAVAPVGYTAYHGVNPAERAMDKEAPHHRQR